jgi:hypothetical protein
MARIELRDATISIKDGLSGTSVIQTASPGSVDTSVEVEFTSLNTTDPDLIPIGARFTVSANSTLYTVTGRTNSAGVNEVQQLAASGASAGNFTVSFNNIAGVVGPLTTANIAYNAAPAAIQTAVDTALSGSVPNYTNGDVAITGGGTADLNTTDFTFSGTSVSNENHGECTVDGTGLTGGGTEAFSTTTQGEAVGETVSINFTPAWGTPTPVLGDTMTFEANRIEVKVGDGNLTWTINKEYEYLLDRGNLDTVREGDQQPLDVTLDSVYEQITTGTAETVTPYDAMNGVGGAAEWVSASADACEPYAVDIQVAHSQPCGTAQDEITVLPDFRYDTLEVDIDAATISFTGRCNAVAPTVTRQ